MGHTYEYLIIMKTGTVVSWISLNKSFHPLGDGALLCVEELGNHLWK